MQQSFSFDRETVKKILKGAAIAATGAAAIGVLEYIGRIEISNPSLAAMVAFLVPTLVNLVREFFKGE